MKNYSFLFLIIINLFTSCETQTSIVENRTVNGKKFKYINNLKKLNNSVNYVANKIINPLEIDSPDDTIKSFQTIVDICIDDRLNIFISDMKNGLIKKFSKKGDYLYTTGGFGRGPGEFIKLRDLSWADDKLVVLDEVGKIEIFSSLSGKRVGGFLLKGLPTSVVSSKSGIYVAMVGGPGITDDIKHVASKYDYNGNLIFSIGSPRSFLESDKSQDMATFIKAFIGNVTTLAIDKNENLYIGYLGQPYLIEKYDSNGNKLLEITRKLDYRITEAGEPDLDGKPSPGTLMCNDIELIDDKIFVTIGGGWGQGVSQNDSQLTTPYKQHIDVFDVRGQFLDSFWFEDIPKAALGYQLCFLDSNTLMITDGMYGNSYCFDLKKENSTRRWD